MNQENVLSQLTKWKFALYFFTGMAVTLLVTTIVDYPVLVATRQAYGGPMLITGWFGLWIVLLIFTTAQGLFLLLGRTYQSLPLHARLGTGFGYLGCGWLALIAGMVRTNPFSLPFLFHFIAIGYGVILAGLYILLSRMKRSEEIFP